MNLEPQRPSEINAFSGTARVLGSLVIPRAAFAEVAGKTAMIAAICVTSVAAIGFLSRR
jgi:hypothetical protein